MATNFYFNNFPKDHITSEQLLIEDLVIESIKQYGMDVYYIPRESRGEVDYLYGEDPIKKFTNAYLIEMYMSDVTGMEGDGDLISKFGLEIHDETTMLVSRRRFKHTVPTNLCTRPREGDLVYIPLVQNFFEITFVEHENNQAMMYTLGRGRGGNVYLYALKMKQFVFAEEKIDTGVDEVDEQIKDSYFKTTFNLSSGTGDYLKDEIIYQGSNLANANATALVYSWNSSSKTLIVDQIIGAFSSANGTIKGNTSLAAWTLSTTDISNYNAAFEDIVDNYRIQTEGNQFIDFSESNPFGTP